MDKPVPTLPYRGPSHSVDVLERVVKRDLLRRGMAWSDLSHADRNARLDDAQDLLWRALRTVETDPLIHAPAIPSGVIRTYEELDDLIGKLDYLAMVHRERSRWAGRFHAALRIHT